MKEEGEARRWQFGICASLGSDDLGECGGGAGGGVWTGHIDDVGGVATGLAQLLGLFRSLQTGRPQAVVLWLAWGLFLLSMLLPSMPPVFGTNSIFGYEAALFVLGGPLHFVGRGNYLDPGIPWFLLMDAANALMLLMPLLIWPLTRGAGHWLCASLCVAMVGGWLVTWDAAMLFGYYVWINSMGLALVASPVRLRTLVAMVVTAAALGLMFGGSVWEPS